MASKASSSESAGETVKVVVRCRPFSSSEKQKGCQGCVKFDNERSVSVAGGDGSGKSENTKDEKQFTFDHVYGPESQQKFIFNTSGKVIVDALLEGYNGTIFAYGQTGSGKTFTMQGLSDDPENEGIIPQTFKHIFSVISGRPERKYLVSVSFLEIYNEEIRDLLVKSSERKSLDMKENAETGFYVKDLSTHSVKHWKEMQSIMVTGNRSRAVGSTLMNEQSSRSHSVFTINVESCMAETGNDVVAAKLHLVDLAGSERQAKTGATGDRLKEATKINLSLAALGNCISALVDKKGHIPYRDSKLTKILQDSLGGNSKTLMIATFSPADYNADETIGTLRYANRAKNIKNTPKVNADPKDTKLKEYQDEISRLRALLDARRATSTASSSSSENRLKTPLFPSSETTNSLSRPVSEKKVKDVTKDILVQSAQIDEERAKREDIKKKLQELESQVIIGGVPLEEHVFVQEKALENARKELNDKKAKQNELLKQVEQAQGNHNQLEDKYLSLQDEIDIKTKKMQKLWNKFQEMKSERIRLVDDFSVERMDLQETIRDLTRDLELKEKIIDLFVPQEWVNSYDQRLIYNEEGQEWIVESLPKWPGKLERDIDSVSLYSRIQMSKGSTSIRYSPRNIYQVPLEKDEE